MPGQQLRFEQWANFYVITSAAAATLLGLLFVVITLAAERRRGDTLAIKIYLTPAVIYFSSVLLISALLTVPNQTRLTAVICICLEGIAGLGYSGFLAIRRGAGYYQRSDLFPYVVFPLAAYALIVAGGLLLLRKPQISLDLVAAGMLALLAIGIRNSWAIATTIVSSQD
jgi:membrane protein CcdC involved in cytochrome C biogenesis